MRLEGWREGLGGGSLYEECGLYPENDREPRQVHSLVRKRVKRDGTPISFLFLEAHFEVQDIRDRETCVGVAAKKKIQEKARD